MGVPVQVIDETSAGDLVRQFVLELASETLTARELIERRVRSEVEVHNSKRSEVFRGLMQPNDTEPCLDGFQLRQHRPIDANAEVRRAFDAFDKNVFVLLVGDTQVEGLDDQVTVTSDLRIAFVKLVPLVGG